MITIPLNPEKMQQLIIKARTRSLPPGAGKNPKTLKNGSLKKLLKFDIKILKNIPLHLETMQ